MEIFIKGDRADMEIFKKRRQSRHGDLYIKRGDRADMEIFK
jgi:hypothetical protein